MENSSKSWWLQCKSALTLSWWLKHHIENTVDGRNPANQLRLVVYPIICRLFAGFLPSTVYMSVQLDHSQKFPGKN